LGACSMTGVRIAGQPRMGVSVIPSLPSVLGWFGPVVGSGHPRGAGCGCHSFALHGSRRLAARHPATTRLLIENCELIAA